MITPVNREHALPRPEFEGRRRDWSKCAADAEWIGDEAVRAQQPWVHVVAGGRVFALNADTKGSGVREYVRLLALDPGRAWSVVENRRGRVNKVAFGPNRITIERFYLYALDEA